MLSSTAPPGGLKNSLPTFLDLLHEMSVSDASAFDLQTDPGRAFRALYDGWVAAGGVQPGGKHRRSVRQIKLWLKEDKKQLRSLETKLAGQTLFKLDDLQALIKLFLDHWNYNLERDIDEPYPSKDTKALAEQLADEIYVDGGGERSSGLRLPERSRQSSSADPQQQDIAEDDSSAAGDTEDSEDAIAELYEETDVLITVSRETTFIGLDPANIMAGFQGLMDRLRSIDENDDRFRSLIWIVDMGRRQSDLKAQAILNNIDFLATQFRAFLMMDHPEREARVRWFLQRTVVVVGTLRSNEIDDCYDGKNLKLVAPPGDKNFNADRLFFGSIPDNWILGIAKAGQAAIQQRTITVHRDLMKRRTDDPGWSDLHFLFHAPRRSPDGNIAPRSVELPGLGVRWSDAFRLVHEVALLRLKRPIDSTLPYSAQEGLSLLKDHQFAALTAQEFCELANHLTFDEFED